MNRTRVLVLSHLYTIKPYRKKFALIAEQSDIVLRIVTPSTWYENFQEIEFVPDETTRCQEFSAPILFSGYVSRSFYCRNIVTHFKDFKPHIIHLEEEAWSLNALQSIVLKRLFCPSSRLIFRTSLSAEIKQRFSVLPILIERLVFKETDIAFPLSVKAGEILRKRGYRGKIVPFPNGVDTELFRKMDVSSLKDKLRLTNHCVVGYVGRLLKMKGLDTLLQAVAQLVGRAASSPYKLLMLGSGEYKANLMDLATDLGISKRIIWVDAVPPGEVPKFINCMDMLVLPSITTDEWVEFFGRVLIEAMACEVPVIGSDSGEIPRVIGKAGLIFPEKDAICLADRIRQIASCPELRKRLIRLGIERVRSKYSWERIAEDTYQVYKALHRFDLT